MANTITAHQASAVKTKAELLDLRRRIEVLTQEPCMTPTTKSLVWATTEMIASIFHEIEE